MANLHHDLQDPRELQTSAIPAKAIAKAINKCILAGGKHCPNKYKPGLPSEIGKYASQHWVASVLCNCSITGLLRKL